MYVYVYVFFPKRDFLYYLDDQGSRDCFLTLAEQSEM